MGGMFYGPRTNLEFLLHSGFVMEPNMHDYLLVKLGVSSSDPLAELKTTLLTALSIAASGEFVLNPNGEPEAPLNAFIRINAMTEAELKHYLSNPQECATLGDAEAAISEENEAKACLFLETRCKLLLRMYGAGTVAEDDAAIASGSHEFNIECAMRQR